MKSITSLNATLTFSIAFIFVVIRVLLDNMSTRGSVEPMDVSIDLKNLSNIKNGGRTRPGSFAADVFHSVSFLILQTLANTGANNISKGEHFMSLQSLPLNTW